MPYRTAKAALFTDEQMIEIGRARDRLGIYRSKVQPYPAYPPEEASPLQVEPKPIFRPRPVDAEIDQLRAGFLFLQKRVNELQAKKKIQRNYEPF